MGKVQGRWSPSLVSPVVFGFRFYLMTSFELKLTTVCVPNRQLIQSVNRWRVLASNYDDRLSS